jgi:hypothetical protein
VTTCPRRIWIWLLAAAFCGEALLLMLYVGPKSHVLDFYHVNFVPEAIRRGFDVYDANQHTEIARWIDGARASDPSLRLYCCLRLNQRMYANDFCPTATPLLYSVHATLLAGSFDVRFWIFHLLGTSLGLWGTWQLARSCGFDAAASWLIVGLIFSFCWGLFLDAQLANVSRYQIFGLALALIAQRSVGSRRGLTVGLCLAVGAAYKPTILPSLACWLLVLLVDRRWRDLLFGTMGLGLGALGAFLFPLVLFDSLDCWWRWKVFAGNELRTLAASFAGNYSPSGYLLARGFDWADKIPWVVMALAGGLFGLTAGGRVRDGASRQRGDLRLCLAIASGPLWSNLASPLTWIQYSALVMPLVIVLLGSGSQIQAARGIWRAVLIGSAILSAGVIQRFVTIEAMWLDAGILWLGWAGLFLAAAWLLLAMRRAEPMPFWLDWVMESGRGFTARKSRLFARKRPIRTESHAAICP